MWNEWPFGEPTLDRFRRTAQFLFLWAATALVSGCSPEQIAPATGAGANPSFFSRFAETDLGARRNGNLEPFGKVSGSARPGRQIYRGDERTEPDPSPTGEANDVGEAEQGVVAVGGDYRLNFENADVATVAKVILGDILQQNYTIDARVGGQINLSSARPVPRRNLLGILETALKSASVSIVKGGGVLRVVPAAEGASSGPMEFGTASEGYGTTVIPVRHVSVQTVARIMENFAARPGAVKADPATGVIIVQGTSQERYAALNAARLIDTDVMRSRSVGIFPLTNSPPETIIVELSKLFDSGEGGMGQNMVKLQPMTRLNAVLVIAQRADILESVARWVRRLDQSDPAAVGVKVYRLKYAQAKTVAAMLNDILAGRSANTGQQDRDALQPQSGNSAGSFVQSPANTSRSAGNTTSSLTASPNGTSGIDVAAAATGANGPGDAATTGGTSGDMQAGLNSGAAQGSLSKVRVTPDIVNNSLLIIASASDYRIVEAAIAQLDRPPVQVAIEVTIAEITLTDQLQYGVQSYLHSNDLGLTKTDQGTLGLTTALGTAAIRAAVPGANLILGPASSPRIVLNALHAVTGVKVLSSPSMVVLDNQAAVLQVGNQVAIKTQSSQSTENTLAPVINSITYKDTGIILKVQPHVHANGIVSLDVEQEISSVVDNSGGVDGLTPTISQRRVKSAIVVSSGQTVLLAGMISEQSGQTHNGLPGLSDWKFLDTILANKNNTALRSELIIFIKPKIMRDQADAQAVSEEFRDRMTAMFARPPKVRPNPVLVHK